MMPKSNPVQVSHNAAACRFEATLDGHLAYATYVREGDRAVFDHTFVPEGLRGRGIAGALVRTALAEARKQGWKVVPTCSYVADFIDRNPEYADLLAEP
jgi:predicted GNAT family acetyltransferase